MATLLRTFTASLSTVASTADALGSLANTAANHAQIWEVESLAALEQRRKEATSTAIAKAKIHKSNLALEILDSRKTIKASLKTEADIAEFNEILKELG